MSLLTRSGSMRRILLASGLFFALLAVGSWGVIDLPAQNPPKKPPVEEEEDPAAGKPKKKIETEDEDTNPRRSKVPIRVDDEETDAKPARKPDAMLSADLDAAAKKTKHSELRKLYHEFSVPHDLVIYDPINPSRDPRAEYVEPLKNFYGPNTEFRSSVAIKPLNHEDWKPLAKSEIVRNSHVKIKPYELLAVEAVARFEDAHYDRVPEGDKNYLSPAQILEAAETVLAAVVRFHDAARDNDQRTGDGWDAASNTLKAKLLEVHLAQLARVAEGKEWEATLAEAQRVAKFHPRPEELEKIARPLVELAQQATSGDNPTEAALREGQRRFKLIDELSPGSAVSGPFGTRLRQKAQNLFEQAKAHQAKNEDKQALDLLDQAEAIWPRLPGLQDLRLRLNNAYPILTVGVRELPANFLPGLAANDAEKQVLELLYEGLVQPTYSNPASQGYAPVLAVGLPKLVPLGREFQFARNAAWSDEKPSRLTVTAQDVRKTVELLGNRDWPGYSPSWAELFDEAHQVGGDPSRVRLTLKRSLVDPLSFMTFKILPRDLTPANYQRFNTKPVGSGPYKLGEVTSRDGRKIVTFVANPTYSGRTGKTNLPRIREIHFVESADPVKDFTKGVIDLYVGPSSEQRQSLRGTSSLVVTEPMPNRRIYFLAVNHLKPALKNESFRRALANAVNREKILDECYRGDLGKKAHRGLNGPFPAGSWACDPTLGPLDRPDIAGQAAEQAAKEGFKDVSLSLLYPRNDPQAEKAMTLLRDQAKPFGILLDLQPMEPAALRDAVEKTQTYDLAYYHYDFASEVYSLKPLFEERNYLNYPPDSQLQSLFGETLSHRNFSEVQRAARRIHGLFYTQMPLVPLWQLDTVVVYHASLKPGPIDPLLLFPGVEEWRLEKK